MAGLKTPVFAQRVRVDLSTRNNLQDSADPMRSWIAMRRSIAHCAMTIKHVITADIHILN